VTDEFDFSSAMIDDLLDEHTADLILSGIDDGELSASLQRVLQLVDLAQSPAAPEELVGERTMVDVMLAALGAEQAVTELESARRRRAKSRAAKAVAALAIVAFTGTAAAATNHLPDSVQTAVADASSHVGLHFPKPKHEAKGTPEPETSNSSQGESQGEGPDATGPAKGGLCIAHAARGTSPSDHAGGVAERNLEAAAATAGQTVDEYCADVVHQPSSSSESPGSDGSEASTESSDASTESSADTNESHKPDDPGNSSSASDHASNGKKPADPGSQGARPAK
jgi:hypothetical protein